MNKNINDSQHELFRELWRQNLIITYEVTKTIYTFALPPSNEQVLFLLWISILYWNVILTLLDKEY